MQLKWPVNWRSPVCVDDVLNHGGWYKSAILPLSGLFGGEVGGPVFEHVCSTCVDLAANVKQTCIMRKVNFVSKTQN